MDSARWQQIQAVFHEASALPPTERDGFVRTACAADQELATEVLAMLKQDEGGTSLLDRGLAETARKTLAMADPLVTKEFGPYRIIRLLGEGGMGVVYLAERKDLQSQVAIKVLRDAWLSPARRERFASEQRTLAQLNHPSIARLYDAAVLPDGTPYFVMEYTEGVPLTQYCREKKCSVEARLKLLRSVCEAVQHAHATAIIHRDLKPSNIFVKSDGSIRLLDFGIAKQLESLDLQVDQTLTGLRLMTPAYAAPEQIRGDRVGISTDVYSLGVILYELLAGELPFDLSNLTPAEAATIIADHDPGRPSAAVRRAGHSQNSDASALSATAWSDLDVLCLTAMHKDPQRRYRSVEALMRDIDHYLNAEPLEARPDTLRYRTAKFVRRNGSAVSTATAVFLLIIAMVTFFTVRLAKARDAAIAETARAQRIQQFMSNLFQGGDEAAGPSDSLRVLTIVDRGVQQAKSLGNEPKSQAELYASLGDIYQKLGKLDQADSLLRSALEERKSVYGDQSPEVAETLTALGLLRLDQAHLDEAEQFTRQGLEIERRNFAQNDPATAKALVAYGRVLSQRGSYDKGIPALEQAVKIESAPNVPPADLAASLSALAEAEYLAGQYENCNPLYKQLLAMHRKIYGEQHPLVADDLSNLAAVQQDLGYYPEAEKFDRQAVEITQAYYGKDHPQTAAKLTSLGRALTFENKFDDAEATLEQALTILEHVYGQVHPVVAETLNELGNVASMRDHLDDAKDKFTRVVEIYKAVYGEKHYTVGIAVSNLGSIYYDKKDYPHAEQFFHQAIQIETDSLGAENVNTGIARIKLGRTLLHEKRYKEGEIETLAGYAIEKKQGSDSNSFIRAARKDLVADYQAMHEPEQAAKYQAELDQAAAAAAAQAKK